MPSEINRGVINKRQDMKTTQEEADTMIVQQVAEVKAKIVLVVADDTDIFVLLLHLCCQGDIPALTSVLMVSPILGQAVIDINATVDHHPRPVSSIWTHWLRYSGNILQNWKGCGTKSPDIWRACSNLPR